MTKEERIRVFEETLECSKNWKYVNLNGDEVPLLREDYNMRYDDAEIYDRNIFGKIDKKSLKHYDTVVEVTEQDCLYAAQTMVTEEHLYPAVLNMASFKHPGGGVRKGSAAQEESICRRTNLYPSIAQFANQKRKVHYPLDINYGAIYSPVVSIFRANETADCEFLEHPVTVDVITASAIKHPKLNPDGTFEAKTKSILRMKIRTIFNVALYNKNDSLVLGAFGCGAYGTPPTEMAKLFKEVMDEPVYKHSFKKIVFAIIEDQNAYCEHNPEGNLVPFKRVFEENSVLS